MTLDDDITSEQATGPCEGAADSLVQLGWVRRAHGIRGLLLVRRMNPGTVVFVPGSSVFLRKGETGGAWYKIRSVAGEGEDLRIGLEGLRQRSEAEALRGHGVFVNRSSLGESAGDEFYFFELVGLTAVNSEGKSIGKVSGVIESPAHEILEIQGESGELLVPFVEAYVGEIDLDAGNVVLHNTDDLVLED